MIKIKCIFYKEEVRQIWGEEEVLDFVLGKGILRIIKNIKDKIAKKTVGQTESAYKVISWR